MPRLDRLDPQLSALLRRDLRLVLRRFSPAVHLAIGTAIVVFAVTATLATDLSFSEPIRRGGLVLGSAVAVLAVVSIVPFLLRQQLAAAWLERAAGVDPRATWGAKVWLAGALAVPPTAIGVLLALLVAPADPWQRVLVAGQVLLAAFAVASVVGTAAFEMAEEPLLSLVFTGFTGLAVAVLYVAYPRAWWLWLAGHLYLVSVLAGHGTRRVRFTEIER